MPQPGESADRPCGSAVGGVRRLLRLEGLAVLVAATLAYAATGASWWLYAVLFLAPDLSFLAYLAGPRLGAAGYNAAHSLVGPVLLGLAGYGAEVPLAVAVALTWAAHVGFDRMLGYGLKYATAFADTHLGRIGRPG